MDEHLIYHGGHQILGTNSAVKSSVNITSTPQGHMPAITPT